MKHHLFISFLSILVSASAGFSQNPEWTYYSGTECVLTRAFAEDNDFMWIGLDGDNGLDGGLFRIEKTTGKSLYFDEANSGLPDNTECLSIENGAVKT
jgi:hypothetical protein